MKRSILLTALICISCVATVFAQLSTPVKLRVRLLGTVDMTGCGIPNFNLNIGARIHYEWINGANTPTTSGLYTSNKTYAVPEPSCDREGRPLVLSPPEIIIPDVNLNYIPSHLNISIEERSTRTVTIARNSTLASFQGNPDDLTHTIFIKRNTDIPGEDFFNTEGYKFEVYLEIPRLQTINVYRDPSRTIVTNSVCAGDVIYAACEYTNNPEMRKRQRVEWEVVYSDGHGGSFPYIEESFGKDMSFTTVPNRVNPAVSVEATVRARLVGAKPASGIQADNYNGSYFRGPWSNPIRVTIHPKAPQINFAGIDSLTSLTKDSDLVNTNANGSLTIAHVPCFGGTNGKVTINQLPEEKNYLVVWKKKGEAPQSTTIRSTNLPYEITGLPAGKYAFIIQQLSSETAAPAGCFSTQYFTIKQPPAPLSVARSSKQDVTCAEIADGSISIEPAGGLTPYTITLQGFAGSTRVVNRTDPERIGKDYIFKNLSGRANGQVINYQVIVGSGPCATVQAAFTLNTPPPLAVNIVNNSIPCFGATADAEATIVGGSGSYTVWLYDSAGSRVIQKIDGVMPGDKPILPGLAAAAYLVRAEDTQGCGGTQRFKLIQPARITVESQLTPSVCGKANGAIALQAAGGVPAPDGSGYTCTLLQGDQTTSKKGTDILFAGLNSGTYAVTITDANNCETQSTYDIVGDSDPVDVDLGSEEFFCAGQTVRLDAGNPGATYQWASSNGATGTGRIFEATTSGTYTVTVTNAQGCQGQGSRKLTFGSDILKADFIASSEGVAGDTVVLINISFPLPDSAYWTFPEGAQVIESPDFVQYLVFPKPGTYTLTLSATKSACRDQISDIITIFEADESGKTPGGRQAGLVSDFVIHPNPSSGKFTIGVQLREATGVAVDVFANTGGAPWASYQGSGSQSYEISAAMSAPSGVYYVVLRAGNEKQVRRIVIYK